MKAKREQLKFEGNDAFYTTLRKNVYEYFTAQNISPKANTQMLFKAIFFLVLFGATYYALVFTSVTALWKLCLCVLHGIAITGIGFNIAHDGGHNSFSKRPDINRLLSYSMDLIGSNSYMWDIKHNKAHHIYTNVKSFDEDITGSPLLRLSPHNKLLKVNRYQHIYAWPLYCILYFYIVWIYNFVQFSADKFGPFNSIKHPANEWIKLFVWKLFYVGYAVVFPIWWLNLSMGQFLLAYGIVCATVGFLLGLIFYLAHCTELSYKFPLPVNNTIQSGWAKHQLETTVNFATNNPLVTWFCGGLNFQIEHHLFPEVCSIHYKAISGIVQKHAEKNKIPYLKYDTMGLAIKGHFKAMKFLGGSKQVI